MHRCTRNSPIWRPGGDSLCRYGTSGNVQVIAGLGAEGNSDGTRVLFSQPMGVCVENKKNIFVTDAQVGAVKLPVITDVGHAVKFLFKYIKKTIPGLYSSPEAQVTTHCKFTRGRKEGKACFWSFSR